MIVRILIAAVLGLLFIYAMEAEAAPACGPYDKILERLEKKYNETVVGYGLDAKDNMTMVLVSDKGTYSILAVSAKGIACLVISGEAWASVPMPKKGVPM